MVQTISTDWQAIRKLSADYINHFVDIENNFIPRMFLYPPDIQYHLLARAAHYIKKMECTISFYSI